MAANAWWDLLVADGSLAPARLAEAQDLCARQGGRLDDTLMAMGALDRDTVINAVARSLGVPRVADEDVQAAPRRLARHLPAKLAAFWSGVPFLKDGEALCVAVWDAERARHALSTPDVGGLGVRVMVASRQAVESAREALYPPEGAAPMPPPEDAVSVPPPVTEVPNRDFAQALGLEDPSAENALPRTDPVLLFRRKATPPPLLLTRKKEEPTRVMSVGAAAEKLFEATSAAELGNAITGFMVNHFERVVVLDLFLMPARVVARKNTLPITQREVHQLPGIATMLSEPQPYCGPPVSDPRWKTFYDGLGQAEVHTMLVLPVFQKDHARFMVYADTAQKEPMEDTREFQQLARECGLALETLGL